MLAAPQDLRSVRNLFPARGTMRLMANANVLREAGDSEVRNNSLREPDQP